MNAAWARMLAALVLLCTAVGCGPNEMERKVIKEMSDSLETRCIGRFLIDLPTSFSTSNEEVTLYYGLDKDFTTVDVQIIDPQSDPDKFAARVNKRASDIAADTNSATKGSMLVQRRDLDEKRTLLRYFDHNSSDEYHDHEIHMLVGMAHVLLKADSYEGVIEPVEARLTRLSGQLRPLPENETKGGLGFCLGPVLIDSDHDQEILSQNFRDTRRQDLRFEIYMSAITPDSGESLSGGAARFVLELALRAKHLREGESRLGDMKAEELLLRYKEDGRIEHSFLVKSLRNDPSFAKPTISLQLTTGGQVSPVGSYDPLVYPSWKRSEQPLGSSYVSSSLTDAESVSLWDSIIKSVRLRPGAVRNQAK